MRKFFISAILCATFGLASATAAAGQSNAPAPRAEAAQPAATKRLGDTAVAVTACGAPQTTLITPNSQTLATSLENVNNQIMIGFSTAGTTYWTVMLSSSVVSVVLSSKRGNAVVTFQPGLTAYLVANGSAGMNIFLTGDVIDDGTTYSMTGTFLGTFTC